MPIITISRQMASYGDEIAQALTDKTDWQLITRATVLQDVFAANSSKNEYHLLQNSAKYFLEDTGTGVSYRDLLEEHLHNYVQDNSAVMVGFGSQVILAENPEVLHVRIIAPEAVRVERVCSVYHLCQADSEKIVRTADRKHYRFVSTVFGVNLTDPDLYDLVLNTAALSVDECVTAILSLQRQKELNLQAERQVTRQLSTGPDQSEVIQHKLELPRFKNESETEFARILDMYQIEWQYEPRTFPIEWDSEGNVTSAFSPDFYLPRFDTYLELTTMNQKYVTLKNKKARRLQELYPDIHIRIVYRKDFQSLVERFRNI